jgi:hypothetical protein
VICRFHDSVQESAGAALRKIFIECVWNFSPEREMNGIPHARKKPPGSASAPRVVRGMERREAQHRYRRVTVPPQRRAKPQRAPPCGAPRRRFWAKAPLFRARDPGRGLATRPFIPEAYAAVHPLLVQPLKAGPRSWPGRLAQASRTHGCEPRARAPHLIPLRARL